MTCRMSGGGAQGKGGEGRGQVRGGAGAEGGCMGGTQFRWNWEGRGRGRAPFSFMLAPLPTCAGPFCCRRRFRRCLGAADSAAATAAAAHRTPRPAIAEHHVKTHGLLLPPRRPPKAILTASVWVWRPRPPPPPTSSCWRWTARRGRQQGGRTGPADMLPPGC